jgi:hypothetical protein
MVLKVLLLLHGPTASSKNTSSALMKLVKKSFPVHPAPQLSSQLGALNLKLRMGSISIFSFQILKTRGIQLVSEIFFKLITIHGKFQKFRRVIMRPHLILSIESQFQLSPQEAMT